MLWSLLLVLFGLFWAVLDFFDCGLLLLCVWVGGVVLITSCLDVLFAVYFLCVGFVLGWFWVLGFI